MYIMRTSIICLIHQIRIMSWYSQALPVPVAARSKAQVFGRSPAEIVGSNPTGGVDVCLLWVLCVVRQRSLRRIDHSSRGVLPTMARRCVWSQNLENEEAKARYRAVKIQPRWVVTPRKQPQQQQQHSQALYLFGMRSNYRRCRTMFILRT